MGYPANNPDEGKPSPAQASKQEAKGFACVNRALRTLSAGNRALLRAANEQELLQEMCRVIVDKGGYRSACVAYAEHDEQKALRWKACVGIETEFLQTLHHTWADTEAGQTSTGTAVRTGKPSVGRNILTDPAFASYPRLREDAIKRGYASATAFPLRVEGEVIGCLTMAAAEADAFDEQEVKLLGELADDLAYGIANLRTRIKRDEAQATITRMAHYDALTGLPNRTQLRDRLDAAIQAARQQRHAFALLHLEIGRFHEINEVLGYRQCDQLLQELGRRLVQAIKPDEILARVAEAEFALLLPKGGADYAIQVAQQLLITLHEPVEISGLMVDARVCIGIALFPGHGTEPDVLIRRAEVAVHQAKRAAGGYLVYTGSLEQENARRLALMGDLRRAIEHNELLLYCQPKVDIVSRRVCGAEALVRWQHPQYGMLSTGEFVKFAEQAGLITPLTNWVLESAFSQSYAWHEAGIERPLSVNLSVHDLRDPRLIDRIQGQFATWGVRPELIQFELTESALMEDPAGSLETLKRLKQLDVELFVDDFGTGYSSLSYLQKLPVDSIKIDQSFVTPMLSNDDSAVIVRSTIELGHNLDLEVVAEGVETPAILERLMTLGCDTAQGRSISMPIPANQFGDWEAQSPWH